MPSHAHHNGNPVLRAVALETHRGDRRLFSNLNLELAEGEVLQVHGPNGSGKTTLLRILCGLTLPTSGEVFWGDAEISSSTEFINNINYLGHSNGIKLELTPVENLRVARAIGTNPTDMAPETALEQFNLYGFEDVPAYMLSAGQRRRVALARLLMNKTRCWVLDEPFTALDKAGIGTVESLIDEHTQGGGIAILTTHQPLTLRAGQAREIHLSS